MTDAQNNPINDAIAHNRLYSEEHGVNELPTAPAKHLAVVTCMDSRLDIFGALGLNLGEAHMIRNAGGIATDDVVRSLVLSQRLLGTDRIMVIHHTRCSLEGLDEQHLRDSIAKETGVQSMMAFGAFRDPANDVRKTVDRLNSEPALRAIEIQGFVFDVDSGALIPVSLDDPS